MTSLDRIAAAPRDSSVPATPAQLDETLSSTTPDVPRQPSYLSIPKTIAWAGGLGVAVGALLLRSPGAGWSLGALGGGSWKGAAIGAGLGAGLLGLDRATGGEVQRQFEKIALDRRAQVGFVLSHPTKPWIAGMGLGVAGDARAAQVQLFGTREPLDGPQDAFRHAYAAALFQLRAMRDHGVGQAEAAQLAIDAGEAHEADGQDNNDEHSRAMDFHNNHVGTEVLGDGRPGAGEAADADGFVSEAALRQRIVDALATGRLQVVDRSGDEPSARATTFTDLPRNLRPQG